MVDGSVELTMNFDSETLNYNDCVTITCQASFNWLPHYANIKYNSSAGLFVISGLDHWTGRIFCSFSTGSGCIG